MGANLVRSSSERKRRYQGDTTVAGGSHRIHHRPGGGKAQTRRWPGFGLYHRHSPRAVIGEAAVDLGTAFQGAGGDREVHLGYLAVAKRFSEQLGSGVGKREKLNAARSGIQPVDRSRPKRDAFLPPAFPGCHTADDFIQRFMAVSGDPRRLVQYEPVVGSFHNRYVPVAGAQFSIVEVRRKMGFPWSLVSGALLRTSLLAAGGAPFRD